MKKISLLLILIISTACVSLFGACSTTNHISDSSKSITLSSVGATDFTLTAKPTQHGTVAFGGGKTHAVFGSAIDIYVSPDDGYEVVWVKVNNGNRAEDHLVYFSGDLQNGVIRNLRVEYNIVVDVLFAPIGSVEKISHSYVGAPVDSTSIQTHFNIVSVACVNGSVSVEQYENIEKGTKVKVTALADEGYSLNEIVVRDTEDYKIIEVDADGCFIMPDCDVAIMASFI